MLSELHNSTVFSSLLDLRGVAAMGDHAPSRLVMIEDEVSYGDAFAFALSLTPDLRLEARAADAGAGVELCASLSPDLVLVDYRLAAGQTGTQVGELLRRLGFTKPVVVLTGFEAPQVRREAAEIENAICFRRTAVWPIW